MGDNPFGGWTLPSPSGRGVGGEGIERQAFIESSIGRRARRGAKHGAGDRGDQNQ